ncbi:MAG TPA: AAA family ATPase, partial [Bacteroidales bacterium]|nr:AAA family ATPase [Bacteroidales bacterium]
MQNFSSEVEAADYLKNKYHDFEKEIRKVIVGQQQVVRELLISIFSNGHCLLIGVPGLAKTLLVNTVAKILGLEYNRIQ